ncbi:MAG: metallophosphoesterase [Synechococcales cyanobacterium M58_A2018_015]|nr:metallophosphoesterase [Synechococcales cyanobacterium M58_A2018_015]
MHKLLSGALSVEQLTIDVVGLPAEFNHTKLVQLSDLHFDGLRLSEEMLREAIAVSNQVNPDLVALTGDYVTDDPTPMADLAQRLATLQSRLGTYAVLGNHDIYPAGAKAKVTDALEAVGIQVLWNQIAYPLGAALPIVGLADLWSREFNPQLVMSQLDEATPRIVLSHNPDSAAHLQPWRVDLQLSGHTHGGQIVLPGLGPVPTWYQTFRRYVPKSLRPWIPYMREDCYKVVRHWEWAQGLHYVGSNRLYVNRGLGTYLPGRLFCPPEVTVITLNAKPATVGQS